MHSEKVPQLLTLLYPTMATWSRLQSFFKIHFAFFLQKCCNQWKSHLPRRQGTLLHPCYLLALALSASEEGELGGQGCGMDSDTGYASPSVVISSKGRLEKPFGHAVFHWNQKALLNSWTITTNWPNPLGLLSMSFNVMLVTWSTFHCLKLYICFAHLPAALVYTIVMNTEDSIQ